MPSILDGLLTVVFIINLAISVGILISGPVIPAAFAPIVNSTVQYINASGYIVNAQVTPSFVNTTAQAIVPVNSTLRNLYSYISNVVVPRKVSYNATIYVPGIGYVPNPVNLVFYLFDLLNSFYAIIYTWFIVAPQWLHYMLYNFLVNSMGSTSLYSGYYAAIVNTITWIYQFLSAVAFFWFIIQYVWQPLSWIVGFILGSISSFVQALVAQLSKLTGI